MIQVDSLYNNHSPQCSQFFKSKAFHFKLWRVGEDPLILIFFFPFLSISRLIHLSIQQIFSAYDFPGFQEEYSMCWKRKNWTRCSPSEENWQEEVRKEGRLHSQTVMRSRLRVWVCAVPVHAHMCVLAGHAGESLVLQAEGPEAERSSPGVKTREEEQFAQRCWRGGQSMWGPQAQPTKHPHRLSLEFSQGWAGLCRTVPTNDDPGL